MRIAFLFLIGALAACGHDAPDAVPNIRLGMAPRDVRDRFSPGGSDPGTWQTALGAADDTVLEWTGHDPGAPVKDARFEFHNGMLVAMRVQNTEKTAKEEVWTTPRTVTEKAPAADGGTTITVLARDCPTHKVEADALAARAH